MKGANKKSNCENSLVELKKRKLGFKVDCNTSVLDQTIENGDILEYTQHYHEPPVPEFGDKIEIVRELDGLVVVNKPPGLPTHPSGKYRLNSLTHIVGQQLGHKGSLFPAFRLDRLTSGLVILAKSSADVSKVRKELEDDRSRKQYIAKVEGHVSAEQAIEYPLFDISVLRDFEALKSSKTTGCKHAKTVVSPVVYDPAANCSTVICTLFTGRTHQIRKHLALAGHPIIQDSLYKQESFVPLSRALYENDDHSARIYFSNLRAQYNQIREEKRTDKVCPECKCELFRDPSSEEMYIELHAWRYTLNEGATVYEATPPTTWLTQQELDAIDQWTKK